MADQRRLTIDRIEQATSVIDPVFLNSPQFDCDALSTDLGCKLVGRGLKAGDRPGGSRQP